MGAAISFSLKQPHFSTQHIFFHTSGENPLPQEGLSLCFLIAKKLGLSLLASVISNTNHHSVGQNKGSSWRSTSLKDTEKEGLENNK